MRDQKLEVLIGKEVLHLIRKPKILYWTLWTDCVQSTTSHIYLM
jgi:hypothetical protein